MRSSLSSHIDEFVLCQGWISYWEEIPEYSTRRVVVSQATIKKGDRNLLYEEQEIISTEHHLNLFIKHEDLPNYEIVFELNGIINFTGLVEQYTRKDGSEDYGIYANKQSTLPFEIEQLLKGSNDAYNSFEDFGKSIDYLRGYAIPKVKELILRLEECGNMLPTFHKTFLQYLAELISLQVDIPRTLQRYEEILSSRNYRRSKKKKTSSLHLISQIKEKKKSSKTKKDINQIKNNLKGGFNQ